jgi:hypothetical protein
MHFFFLWGGCRTYCEGLSSEEQCKDWIQVELLLHSYTVPICVQDSTRFAIASFWESLIVDALFRSFRRVQDILWRTQFWKIDFFKNVRNGLILKFFNLRIKIRDYEKKVNNCPTLRINQIDSTQYMTAFRPTKITIRKNKAKV